MKLLFISLFISTSILAQQELEEVYSFGENPGDLRMFQYVPKNLSSKDNVPLVVVLHGCSQNAKEVAHDSGWNDLADEYHFIVVYPQQRRKNNTSNCFNWFLEKDIEGEKGELCSIRSMIDFQLKHQKIDSEMIFSYGLSAGAMMSVSLLANFPDLFNAGASFAGGAYKSATNAFQGVKMMRNAPMRSGDEWSNSFSFVKDSIEIPRLLVVHGKKDNIVAFENSEELVKQWNYMSNCRAENIISKVLENHSNVTERKNIDENGLERIRFYEISNIGHKLPVNPGSGVQEGGREAMYSKDVDFYSTYYACEFFGLL